MNRIIVFIAAVIVLASCNPLKKIETTYNSAESNYSSQSYKQAYDNYIGLISMYKSQNLDVPNAIYLKAADCASQIGNLTEAQAQYQNAMSDSLSITAIKGYVSSLKKEQNYTDVVKVLESNAAFIDSNNESVFLQDELFNAAISLNDNEKILSTYDKASSINEAQSLTVIKAMEAAGKEKDAMLFANKTIKENPSFYEVKEWKGSYYYGFAEKWYKSEMDKYNKDKNYTAYVYLKRELKKISANYRIAKDIFEELHKVNPSDTKNIKYLKNIYLRLELNKEAEAMDKLLK